MSFSSANFVCVVFVAFAVWLGWRIVKKRDLWAMRTAEAIVAAFLAIVLLALLLPAVQAVMPFRLKRTLCRWNLMQIGFALHQYHDEYGSFPPAYIADEQGRPIHSWRMLLLPYMDAQPRYS